MHSSRKFAITAGVFGAGVIAAVGATPALAQTSRPFARVGGPALVGPTLPGANLNQFFGGWAFAPKGATSVKSDYVMPARLTCSTALSAVAAEAEMFTGSSANVHFNSAGVFLICQGAQRSAFAEVTINGTLFKAPQRPFPNDHMRAKVARTATTTTATIQDLTAGHAFTFTRSGAGAPALQEQIGEAALASGGGTKLPVPNFGSIPFSAGSVSSTALGAVNPRAAFNMVNAANVVEILTGPLTGVLKNAFVTTWKHS